MFCLALPAAAAIAAPAPAVAPCCCGGADPDRWAAEPASEGSAGAEAAAAWGAPTGGWCVVGPSVLARAVDVWSPWSSTRRRRWVMMRMASSDMHGEGLLNGEGRGDLMMHLDR
jgi:hypothetical protein